MATDNPFERVVVWVGRIKEFEGVARALRTMGRVGLRNEEDRLARADGTSNREEAMISSLSFYLLNWKDNSELSN